MCLHLFEQLTLAVIHHRKDLDIAVRYDFKDAYMRALENLGVTYEKMGDYAQVCVQRLGMDFIGHASFF